MIERTIDTLKHALTEEAPPPPLVLNIFHCFHFPAANSLLCLPAPPFLHLERSF